MTRSADFDDLLSRWLRDGAEHAPERHLAAALDRVATTGQRRPSIAPWARGGAEDSPDVLQAVIAAAAAVLLAAAVGIGIQVGVIRWLDPAPIPPPLPSPSEAPAVDRFSTFTAPDGSFQIRLPDAWALDRGPDPAVLYLTRGNIDLSLRAGNADGEVVTCDAGKGPWEECKTSTATTLAELQRDVTLTNTPEEGVAPEGPFERAAMLDGDSARIEEISAYEHPARGGEWVSYVMAVHDGRPFVIRLWSPTSALGTAVAEVLEGFEFDDPADPEL